MRKKKIWETVYVCLNNISCTRSRPRKAEFNSAPESSAETGEGASEWASGSHAWIGAMPIFCPQADKDKCKRDLEPKWIYFGMRVHIKSLKNKEWMCRLPIERTIMPTNASAIPIEQIKCISTQLLTMIFSFFKMINIGACMSGASNKNPNNAKLVGKKMPTIETEQKAGFQ